MSVSPAPLFSFSDFETACVYFLNSGEIALCIQEDIPQKCYAEEQFSLLRSHCLYFQCLGQIHSSLQSFTGLSMTCVGFIHLDNKLSYLNIIKWFCFREWYWVLTVCVFCLCVWCIYVHMYACCVCMYGHVCVMCMCGVCTHVWHYCVWCVCDVCTHVVCSVYVWGVCTCAACIVWCACVCTHVCGMYVCVVCMWGVCILTSELA